MSLNNILYVAANNQEAIYFDGELLVVKDSFSAKELSNILSTHSPFNFSNIVIDDDIDTMPENFDIFDENLKNPYKINKDDMVTFTTQDGNSIIYSTGKVMDIKKNENGFIEAYLLTENKSKRKFTVYPHGKGKDKKISDTIMLLQTDDKIDLVDMNLIEDVFNQRKSLLLPKVEQSVSFNTKKGSGSGVIKEISVRPYYTSGGELSYSCKIQSKDGVLTEVYFGNKRYPEDEIHWSNAPVFLSKDKI